MYRGPKEGSREKRLRTWVFLNNGKHHWNQIVLQPVDNLCHFLLGVAGENQLHGPTCEGTSSVPKRAHIQSKLEAWNRGPTPLLRTSLSQFYQQAEKWRQGNTVKLLKLTYLQWELIESVRKKTRSTPRYSHTCTLGFIYLFKHHISCFLCSLS